MSAFFLSINRDGSAFDEDQAQTMMRAIKHFGCDQRHLVVTANVALGYQSLWTVPEEQGERQPLFDSESQTWLMLYGRIDNRDHLLRQLELDSNDAIRTDGTDGTDGTVLSDAALLHAFLLSGGEARLGQVVGPFVFVLFNQRTGELLAARDAMGGRHLVYKITAEHIHVATYELALVAHSSVDYRFNQARLGRWVSNMMEDQLSSNVLGLTPLNPGELITVNSSIAVNRSTREMPLSKVFYRHDARKRVVLKTDQDYADEFRRLLDQAVKRRMRSVADLGCMLSGGFDSVPIAISMAEAVSAEAPNVDEEQSSNQHGGRKITALSWVHDRYPEADERVYSGDICQRFEIEQVCINCDDIWPILNETDDAGAYCDPILPFSIPYTEYHQAAFREAQQRGIRAVMTGIHGDLLYGHSESVFAELLANRQWRKLSAEFRRYWRTAPSRWQVIKHFVIKQLPGVRRFVEWRRLRRPVQSSCLQDAVLQQLKNCSHPLFEESLGALRPQHYQVVFGGFAGEDMAMGRHMEAKYQLERRYPLRDRDLCEFISGVPSDQLHFNFTPRPIVRNAFKRELGEALLARRAKTEFSTVISDGIKRDQSWRPWFSAENAAWQRFVKQRYFETENMQDHSVELVKWRCAYYDYWKSVCYTRICDELGIKHDI